MAERKVKAKPPAKQRGRPVGTVEIYKPDVVDHICARLSEGQVLSEICRGAGMPERTTVYLWMKKYPDFAQRVARAREAGYDAIAEEALRIADTPILGEETTDDGEKVTVKKADAIQHRKLQVWTRLELLKKWDPKRYGDRSQVDMTVTNPLAERLARAKERLGGK